MSEEIVTARDWWIDREDSDYVVLVVGFDHYGDPVIQDKRDDFASYETATFLKKFKREPDCTGFDWVKPEPVPVESPDDWVTQDCVPIRVGVDQFRYPTYPPRAEWRDVTWGACFGNEKHGDIVGGDRLEIRCRRKDLPKPPEPAKTRVELRLWVSSVDGHIVHYPVNPGMHKDAYYEVLFDSTGQPYYLKD